MRVINVKPDWRSDEGSSEQVWATSEFQLSEGGLKVFDDFGGDDVGMFNANFSFSAFQIFSISNRLSSSLSHVRDYDLWAMK